MKTSFYFVIWMVIYPLLGLLNSPMIDQNSFLIALILVWGLAWFINRSIPQIIRYEKILEYSQIMNEVYTGNVQGFRKRLGTMATIEFISALYFGVAFVFSLFLLTTSGSNGWLELLIFGFLAFGTVSRAAKLQKLTWRLRKNPNPQECVSVVDAMGLDYASYYDHRRNVGKDAVLPPAPRHFKAFRIFSIIMSAICIILGLLFLVMAMLSLIAHYSILGVATYGIMTLLYGSLAVYFGIKDIMSSIKVQA